MGLDLARARWRTLAASVAGTSHARAGQPCADASAVRVLEGLEGESLLVAVAADGAGTSLRAKDGARLACDAIVAQARQWLGRPKPRGARVAAARPGRVTCARSGARTWRASSTQARGPARRGGAARVTGRA